LEALKAVMTRLNRLGKGALLLHGAHQRTADMVPMLLRDLKAKGYRRRAFAVRGASASP